MLALSAVLNVLLRLEASPFRVKRKTVMLILIHHDKFFVFRIGAWHFERSEDWEEKRRKAQF